MGGGSASAVFSAARFRFPFESLSYTIYEYGIGALRTWSTEPRIVDECSPCHLTLAKIPNASGHMSGAVVGLVCSDQLS